MSEPLFTATLPSPIGPLTLVASDEGLRALHFPKSTPAALPEGATEDPAHPILAQAIDELNEYFVGTRTTFEVPLDPKGTPFQMEVWLLLRDIPYGTTTTYDALARLMGHPNKARAVGMANARNPVGIILPCHRVIGSSGALTGFAGGIETKSFLLQWEQQRGRGQVQIATQGNLFG